MYYIKYFLFFFFFSVFINDANAQNKGDALFSETLHEIKIFSTTEPDLHATLQSEAMTGNYPYHLVDVVIDGEEVDSVGLRVKGFLSAAIGDPTPLKIDFNEYIAGRNYDGLKKININNSFFDDYKLKDRVSLELFKRAGIPSSRSSYAEIYINDQFIGLYVLIEQVDKTFLKQNFATNNGTLKKIKDIVFGDGIVFENLSDDQLFEGTILRNFFKYLLVELIIKAEDNYSTGLKNNYYIYYDSKDEHYHFIPWDHNLSLRGSLDDPQSIYPAVHSNKWSDPDVKSLYLEVACELSEYLLDETYITNLLNSSKAIIDSNSNGVTTDDPAELFTYLMGRKQWLINALNSENATCSTLQYPFQDGDLVINEILAKSDSLGGVQEPNGGTPDWIELYNNTNSTITLDDRFYLSNDVDFPKKWNFKEPITIQPDGYQIVWADRDIHQEGIHSNFKIDKDGGELLLTFEDLTPIELLEFGKQELNKGYARVPNGTGNFVIQDHTFNTNNEIIISTEENENSVMNIFPNPVTSSFKVDSEIPIVRLSLYNAQGQLLLKKDNPNDIIDVLNIRPGVLFLYVQTESKTSIFKLIKH